jgi:hypothetical protein
MLRKESVVHPEFCSFSEEDFENIVRLAIVGIFTRKRINLSEAKMQGKTTPAEVADDLADFFILLQQSTYIVGDNLDDDLVSDFLPQQKQPLQNLGLFNHSENRDLSEPMAGLSIKEERKEERRHLVHSRG